MAEVVVVEAKDYQGMCGAVVIKAEHSNLSDILEIWKSNGFLYQLIKKGGIRKILNMVLMVCLPKDDLENEGKFTKQLNSKQSESVCGYAQLEIEWL